MKTIIFLAFLALTSVQGSAAIVYPNQQPALEAFKKDFASATDISWEQSGAFLKVNFSFTHQVMQAYYTYKGELISIVRNITSDQLPLLLLLNLKSLYKEYWITELFEQVTGNDHSYILTIENSEKQIILRTTSDRTWTPVIRKNKS